MSERQGRREGRPKKQYAVMPYYHEISHNVKACAKKFGADLVFSTDFKLEKIILFSFGDAGVLKRPQGEVRSF